MRIGFRIFGIAGTGTKDMVLLWDGLVGYLFICCFDSYLIVIAWLGMCLVWMIKRELGAICSTKCIGWVSLHARFDYNQV